MACRQIVTAKHMAVARLLVDGESGYRALRQCGYSHYSARNFGLVLRHSWGLRQAIMDEQKKRSEYLVPRPARRRRDKYARRPVAQAVRTYCAPEFQEGTTNAGIRYYEKMAKEANRIAAGLPPKAKETARMIWCPSCGVMASERDFYLNPEQTFYICSRCAGVT